VEQSCPLKIGRRKNYSHTQEEEEEEEEETLALLS
jgi:hypothetical protein